MNILRKIKEKVTNQFHVFMANHPEMAKPVLAIGMMTMMATNTAFAADGKQNLQNTIAAMVDIVSTIFLGVGVIYAIVAIFNWVSAMKQEDAERQSKSITNIMIAAVLVLVKPITMVLLGVMGADTSAYENSNTEW